MAQITGTHGPAANGQISRQQSTQNLAQERAQERTRTRTTNARQNDTATAGQMPQAGGQVPQAAGQANPQNSPEQNVGKNVNIVA